MNKIQTAMNIGGANNIRAICSGCEAARMDTTGGMGGVVEELSYSAHMSLESTHKLPGLYKSITCFLLL